MKKFKYISIIGLLIAILPYLGFPYYIKNFLFVLSGLLILYFSYSLNKEILKKHKDSTQESDFENFSENKDFTEEK